MIANKRSSWLLNKFSLSALKDVYGEQYREDANWFKGVIWEHVMHMYFDLRAIEKSVWNINKIGEGTK